MPPSLKGRLFEWPSEPKDITPTHVPPPPSKVKCHTCQDTGHHLGARLYPSGHTEVEECCIDCSDTPGALWQGNYAACEYDVKYRKTGGYNQAGRRYEFTQDGKIVWID
mgnify:CR=1 FL=1